MARKCDCPPNQGDIDWQAPRSKRQCGLPNGPAFRAILVDTSWKFGRGRNGAERQEPVLVDLALQGGGSHGAFTWGVLDRLLEESWLRISGISGTSAGAMNAALLADGWTAGGSEGARGELEKFWQRVSQAAAMSPLQRSPLDRLMGRWTLDTSPAYLAMDLMSRVFSPYDLNLIGFNPLRDILAEVVDFERLARSPIKLFVTATSVRTGRGRIFRNREITADVLLASACLPTMYQAGAHVLARRRMARARQGQRPAQGGQRPKHREATRQAQAGGRPVFRAMGRRVARKEEGRKGQTR